MEVINNKKQPHIVPLFSKYGRLLLPASVVFLFVAGFLLYKTSLWESHLSRGYFDSIVAAKGWSLGMLLFSALLLWRKRHSQNLPLLIVFALSVYFVILYGVLFINTEYGMNAVWGDNSNRLAEICKMIEYKSFYQDWYLKSLPSFYPPLWFWLMTVCSWVFNLEAYQIVKFGYLLIFIFYPWLIFFSWRKLVSPLAAALVAVTTIFIGYKHLDWIYYEHITAALFLPWWLYYFEGAVLSEFEAPALRFYLWGGLLGGLLFMTYYYWFFMAAAAFPIGLLIRYYRRRDYRELLPYLKRQLTMAGLVAVFSSPYWLPLIISIIRHGMESFQGVFFGLRHTDITAPWATITPEALLIAVGLAFSFYLWKSSQEGGLPIALLFAGGLILIILDRFLNLAVTSVQSRKVIELAHVFAMAPLGIGLMSIVERVKNNRSNLRWGLGITFILLLAFSNSHTEIYKDNKYQTAIKYKKPSADLAIFRSVDFSHKVFLTPHYIEACYIPYYLFIPVSSAAAHTASQYSQRLKFLEEASAIVEPDLLAYALTYNRYSSIDYIYLPANANGKLEMSLNQLRFNQEMVSKTITFAGDIAGAPEHFSRRHERGLYEITAPERSQVLDSAIEKKYSPVLVHLK